jgi:hypothetical protein
MVRSVSDEGVYSIATTRTLLTGVAMGESPRWHEGRLWFSDWGAQEIVATDMKGNVEVIAQMPFGLPFCVDWLADAHLLIAAGRESRLLRRESDSSFLTHRDLGRVSSRVLNLAFLPRSFRPVSRARSKFRSLRANALALTDFRKRPSIHYKLPLDWW